MMTVPCVEQIYFKAMLMRTSFGMDRMASFAWYTVSIESTLVNAIRSGPSMTNQLYLYRASLLPVTID
jgi:hypothetical protein